MDKSTSSLATTVDTFAQAHGPVEDQENTENFYADIPDIKTAEGETLRRMTELKDSIDPYDLNTINSYAKEPGQGLIEVSRMLLDKTNSAGAFLSSLSGFRQKIQGFDFNSVEIAAKKYTAVLQRRAAQASLTLARNPVAVVGGGVGGRNCRCHNWCYCFHWFIGSERSFPRFEKEIW